MKFLALILLLASPAGASDPFQEQLLPPQDESAKDPSFEAFRKELLSIVKRRDAEGLLARTADTIKYSFGAEDASKKSFAKEYEISKTTSSFWRELEEVLGLGCIETIKSSEFQCPYVFARWPDGLDGFTDIAVMRKDAKLYQKPEKGAAVVRALKFEIVREAESEKPLEGWGKVNTSDGKTGFVKKGDVRGPLNYRAFFRKNQGKWLMNTFIAGD